MPPSLRPLIVGNWKMNGLRDAAAALTDGLAARAAASPAGCGIVVCPPATLLSVVGEARRRGLLEADAPRAFAQVPDEPVRPDDDGPAEVPEGPGEKPGAWEPGITNEEYRARKERDLEESADDYWNS